ncbi:hypothetical protein [Thioalkalivibrio sp. ALMg11]|uniref:hypothetical protein n=1 Tax=Thioalkalivibrio sp. ALMg11 TaxID=1158165 RepID=UPI00036D3B77|nr:hypothetical protein [Thioalkalivibrio sp. ALMg11]
MLAKSVNAQAGGRGESSAAIGVLLEMGRDAGVKTGLGGQAPNDDPEFAAFRLEQGIDRISVSVRRASWR